MRTTTAKLLSAFGSIALTAGLVGLSDPAMASTVGTEQMQRVVYDRASLDTPAGRAAVRQQIKQASAAVCASDEADRDAVARCQADATARAKHDLVGQLLAGR